MKKIVVCALFAAMLILCGCSGNEIRALHKTIEAKVLSDNPRAESFSILSATVCDSVTFSEELSRRVRLFETKVKVEDGFVAKYSSKNLKANTALHTEKAEHAREILRALEEYRQKNASCADSVIYYVVEFVGSGKLYDGTTMEKVTMSAAVGTDLNVYKLSQKRSGIYSGMGVALPGYMDLLKSMRSEGEE